MAKKLDRKWIGCELSEEYVRAATERLSALQEGVALNGPADPIASAPSTANGRQLSDLGISGEDESQVTRRTVAVETKAVTSPERVKPAAPKPAKRELREVVRDAIVDAFYATHDGASIDWMLVNPGLQERFHVACRAAGLIGSPADWNHELLRLRKTGEFPKRGTINKVLVADDQLDAYNFAAEIAWRLTNDKFNGPSIDEIFCDPAKAVYFDRAARRVGPGFEAAQYRWAALRLRKASREMVNEVKQYHFVFAKRDFRDSNCGRVLSPSDWMVLRESTCCATTRSCRCTSATRSIWVVA